MKPVMYLFLNRGLNMTEGKQNAQAGHAAVRAFRLSDKSRIVEKPKGVGWVERHLTREEEFEIVQTSELVKAWDEAKHETKLVMLAEDETHLHNIQKYIEERGFKTALIIDEGRTEVRPHSATALGVEIVDKDDPHVVATFEVFRTYKKESPKKKKKRFRK